MVANSHISRVHPRAGVEGGRVSIFGEGLGGSEPGQPVARFNGMESRPRIVTATRIVAPIPEGATSGPLSLAWPEAVIPGPDLAIAQKLAEELHPVANPVVDAQGNVFTTFSGARGQPAPGGVSVYRISPEGGAEPHVSDLMNATGLAVDPEGTLFISCRNDGTVRKVAGSGQTDIFIDGMGIATGIAFDRSGTLYVGDRSGGIFSVEPQGSMRRFAKLPASVAAYHLAVGPDDHLYVTAPTLSNDDPVFRIDPSGRVSHFFQHLARPQGLAFDPEGGLFVVAIYRGERGIFRIGADGEAALMVAGENLVGLAFDDRGSLYITSGNAIFRLGWPLS